MLEYILKKKKYILILPFRCDYTKSYPEIAEEWIANTPKMAAVTVLRLHEAELIFTNKSTL